MPKRKEPSHAKEEDQEGQGQVLTTTDTQIKRRLLLSIEERSDGQWRIEIVGGNDDSTMPGSAFRPRREFLRDYHRALEQLNNLVFRGSIRKV